MPIELVLYDFMNDRGENEIAAWSRSLQKDQRAKLNAKLDMLASVGMVVHGNLLAGPLADQHGNTVPIYKLKIRGNVQLRLMLCRGPIDNDREFTLLFGATEVGNRLVPINAVSIAAEKREHILRDVNRRCQHERTS